MILRSIIRTLNDLIAALESALNKWAVRHPLPLQPGDVNITYADVSRAEAELGYRPSTPIAVGLRHFVRWLRGATV